MVRKDVSKGRVTREWIDGVLYIHDPDTETLSAGDFPPLDRSDEVRSYPIPRNELPAKETT